MLYTDILVIGGGPAGLSATKAAAEQGFRVTLLERDKVLGGQLSKQTHRFFGSEKERAGIRGIDIAKLLIDELSTNKLVDIRTNAEVLGVYNDDVITFIENGTYHKMSAGKVIFATGASEKMLLFPGNDLPGVYGAGAVQTLMNIYGVKPGDKVLMVGAGNIGLIVTYQMLQAGVDVVAIVDAADRIGGYLVHASKVRRLGVPIYTRTTIKEAVGENFVEKAVICNVDDKFQPIEGSEQELDVDTVCLSVGLTPMNELLKLAKCELKYVPVLGGYVPVRDAYMETTKPGYYVAGDLTCIEEASAAMVEGSIAGLSAVISMGAKNANDLREEYIADLASLRAGEVGEKIRFGLSQL